MATIAAFLSSDEAGRLKAELQNLRRKGALKASTDWDSTNPDPDRSCGRCRVELGRVINRGAYCRSCRMKVCKSCREYSLRTTDWVCTVCHKRMEIQAASGEWMNEFVRRPSRRRDNRVYVPAADIIKRTIRRSWTISNPQPRWNTPRNSPLIRAYSSLPRGQDIDNYPYLASLKVSNDKPHKSHNTACRSLSEDIYSEREPPKLGEAKPNDKKAPEAVTPNNTKTPNPPVLSETSKPSDSTSPTKAGSLKIETETASKPIEVPKPPSPRINPLTKAAAEGKLSTAVPFEIPLSDPNKSPSNKSPKLSPRQTSQPTKLEQLHSKSQSVSTTELSAEKKGDEKRVSFDEFKSTDFTDNARSAAQSKTAFRQKEKSILKPVSKSFEGPRSRETKTQIHPTHSLPEEVITERVSDELHFRHNKKEGSNEQCDIEPISGTVFRKVTVRRRRQDMKKLPAIDNGRRKGRDPDVLDILLPEGDDYKLVFVSSDSSSKEEDVDDNDSSSTASSFLIDECDWDYFEPNSGVRPLLNWSSSPFGSPNVYRRYSGIESPLGSPLGNRRRVKECDASTDEDMARLESVSPASLDSTSYCSRNNKILEESGGHQLIATTSGETLSGSGGDGGSGGGGGDSTPTITESATTTHRCAAVHRPENFAPRRELCQSCGSPTQYVPIPVPVPIPIPVLWSSTGSPHNSLVYHGSSDLVDQYLRERLLALPFSIWSSDCSQSAFILPLITAGGPGSVLAAEHGGTGSGLDECARDTRASIPAAPERDVQPSAATAATDQNFISTSSGSSSGANKDIVITTCPSTGGSSSPAKDLDCEVEESREKSECVVVGNGVGEELSVEQEEMSGSGGVKVTRYSFSNSQLAGSMCGHLVSENANMSSDSSSDASSSDVEENEPKKRVCRTYNISGGNVRESDDALPTSSSEVSSEEDDDLDRSSPVGYVKEDESSPSSDSSDTESDDTGTVADQKVRHFSRILVLNEDSSIASSAASSSTSSIPAALDSEMGRDTDSFDSDADEENECGIVLTCIKQLEESGTTTLTNGDELKSESGENGGDKTTGGANVGIESIGREAVKAESKYDTMQARVSLDKSDAADNPLGRCDNGGVDFNRRTPTISLDSIIDRVNRKKSTSFDDCLSPSPGLSDVSAESHHSSDVEVPFDFSRPLARGDDDDKPKEEALTLASLIAADSGAALGTRNNTITSTSANVRCDELEEASGGKTDNNILGERAGAPVVNVADDSVFRHAARYTSLVMITQEPAPSYPQVSVVTSDTTTLVPDGEIVVRHTNWQNLDGDDKDSERDSTSLPSYFRLTLENSTRRASSPQEPIRRSYLRGEYDANVSEAIRTGDQDELLHSAAEDVTVVTGGDTLSAVICHEDGLADDDSWVENLSNDGDDLVATTSTEESSSGEEVTLSCTSAIDHEDELRGYHRAAIDFTLHTIVEESCEDSEIEQPPVANNKKTRPASVTDLEKYFYFGLSDGNVNSISSSRDDAHSETSSICSESLDSLGAVEEIDSNNANDSIDSAGLSSSRLEKYFLSEFMGFEERRDSDGSVGSDSEGHPSPEQRRKRLVRARGTGRSHSSSLDNLLISNEASTNDQHSGDNLPNSDDISSSDTDTNDDINVFEKSDPQLDTVKRKKNNKKRASNSTEELNRCASLQDSSHQDANYEGDHRSEDDDGSKTPQPELVLSSSDSHLNGKQQSRDSGFVGSCDDLIKADKDVASNFAITNNNETELSRPAELSKITEERVLEDKFYSPPPATSLTRKDSFNNWSSDEETNLMMSKVKQFFKTMVVNCTNNQNNVPSSKPGTPVIDGRISSNVAPSPRLKSRFKSPQLVHFENELTRLMKTVPGIRDEQVRELVEYFSSEDTWSDSYDSSDYTSSDLEGASACTKTLLQQQISNSCQEIISKFEQGEKNFEQQTDGTAASRITNLNGDALGLSTLNGSSPSMVSILQSIGARLVALMYEVSSGDSHASNSPKNRHYHRRLHQKLSNASSTTTEDDDSTSDNVSDKQNILEDDPSLYNLLPRSRSHDLLLSETKTLAQSNSGVSDMTEERETSDYERFSWRGSFESALMATDSRNKLSLLGSEGSASASALAVAAKRRSAGDLMFNHKSLSREQLDRVRSCGSIGGGGDSEDKLWSSSAIQPNRRRSSVPDAASGSGGSADGEDDDEDEDEDLDNRATLPRSLQTSTASTNSLPRLPTNTGSSSMYKSHSMHHFLQQNVKSARYRPPGFSKFSQASPKRASSAPGLHQQQQRRGRKSQQSLFLSPDDANTSETSSSPLLASRGISKSATPSPVAHSNRREMSAVVNKEWHSNEDDIDRLVAIHNRGSLSSLGLRSDSMASVYSGAGEGRYGTVAVRGQVEFGLQYNYKAGALEILVKQCKDLAAVDTKRNRSDPYVKVYLLPDKSKSGKRKTKVKKHTLNPVFDESLKFHISLNGLETRTLWLTVWHSDMFGRNDFLGEVMMALENKVFDDPTPKWYNLQERTEPFEDILSFKGDILVCLKFVPPDIATHKKGKLPKGALHVKVKEARSLMAVKTNGTSDPFCKSYLLPDKGRSSKQKTPVMRKTVNPVWNHMFVYENVTLQDLIHRCLELTVWDHDRLGSNEFLGGVRFSLGTGKYSSKAVDWMDSTGKELALWQSMLDRPNFWVEGCLPLRPTLDQQTA